MLGSIRLLLSVAVFGILMLLPAEAGAQAASFCRPGQSPQFVFGFAALKAELGPIMGEPTTCEYPDPNGSGDTLQMTTTGLAFWRKSTNTPTFTDGWRHWALTPGGRAEWEGASIDPPGVAASGPAPAPAGTRVAVADYFPSDREMPPRFARVGVDPTRLTEVGELVGRIYRRPDGSMLLLFGIRGESAADARRAYEWLVGEVTRGGLQVVSESRQGEGGVMVAGQVEGQSAAGVIFRSGVFSGGAVLTGPIVAIGTADPDAQQQLAHVLTVMEARALAYPAGYR